MHIDAFKCREPLAADIQCYGEYLQRRISAKDQVEMTELFFMRYLIISSNNSAVSLGCSNGNK